MALSKSHASRRATEASRPLAFYGTDNCRTLARVRVHHYLPSYEESVIEVEMDAELARAYADIEKDIRDAVSQNRGNRSLMSLMMHRLLLYPDHPFGIGEIWGKVQPQHEVL
jgi:hypothetical protein